MFHQPTQFPLHQKGQHNEHSGNRDGTLPIVLCLYINLVLLWVKGSLWLVRQRICILQLHRRKYYIVAFPGKIDADHSLLMLLQFLSILVRFFCSILDWDCWYCCNFPALELILNDCWQQLFLTTLSKHRCPLNSAIWAHNMCNSLENITCGFYFNIRIYFL